MASHLNLLESLNVCYLELLLSIQPKEKICNQDKFMEGDYIEPQKLVSELLNKSSIVTKSIFEISFRFIINTVVWDVTYKVTINNENSKDVFSKEPTKCHKRFDHRSF